MITIVVVGIVTAVAVFAILMKLFAGESQATEKLQKGDIIKQLIELSELENPGGKGSKPARAQSVNAAGPTPRAGSSLPKPTGKIPGPGGPKPNPAQAAESHAAAATALVKVSPPASIK